MKILVIGGNGFFGTYILNAMSTSRGNPSDLFIGSRSGGLNSKHMVLNLDKTVDYPKLCDFDFVVNCAGVQANT